MLGKRREVCAFLHKSAQETDVSDIRLLLVEQEHTSSIDRSSAATRFCAPSTAVCFARVHGVHRNSFSSTVTTSLSIGGS